MIYRSAGLVLVALVLIAIPLPAQSAAAPSTTQPKVVLTKLGPIAYPQIARTAHITGEVVLELDIRQDGSVLSAQVASGPPLLTRAALQSAQQSQFECQNCGEKLTPLHLVYTFTLVAGDMGNCASPPSPPNPYPANQAFPAIRQTGNRITIVDRAPPCYAYDTILGKRRSWKCLYLWHCAR